jgi:uncharacterized protein (TIGR03435 family)
VKSPLTFDAASVKPTTIPSGVTVSGSSITASRREDFQRVRGTGGPGTSDPSRIHYPIISVRGLLDRAFDAYPEIRGPGWLDSDVVQVDATMPPDTTKEQFKEMLRNLITDRFRLKYHIETKEKVVGYSLVVAKNGPKMKESVEGPAPEERKDDAPRPPQIGPDGFRVPPRGPTFGIAAADGQRARLVSQQQTMETLAQNLGKLLKSQVTDATGLNAKYDFTVTFSGGLGPDGPYALALEPSSDGAATPAGASDPTGLPDIFSALQSQIGLKLEQKKVPMKVMIVDHIEKAPTAN